MSIEMQAYLWFAGWYSNIFMISMVIYGILECFYHLIAPKIKDRLNGWLKKRAKNGEKGRQNKTIK